MKLLNPLRVFFLLFLILFLLLAFVPSGLLAENNFPPGTASPQNKPKAIPLNLKILFQEMPEEKKFDALKMKLGVKFKNQYELLDKIGDPALVLYYVTQESEPIPPRALSALEKYFPGISKPKYKYYAAVILYRYKSKLGLDFLLRKMEREYDITATMILAMNQEPKALDYLLENFGRIQKDYFEESFLEPLVWMLGRYGRKADRILEQGLNPKGSWWDFALALGLGDHNLSPASIKTLKSLAFGKHSIEGLNRFPMAALLNHDPGDEKVLALLLEETKKFDTRLGFEWWAVFQALERSRGGTEEFHSFLVEYLRDRIRNYTKKYHFDGELPGEALRYLLRIEHPEAMDLGFQYLELTKSNPYLFGSVYKYGLMQAILWSNQDPGVEQRLDEFAGEGYSQAIKKLNTLNMVPSDFLRRIHYSESEDTRFIHPHEPLQAISFPKIQKPEKPVVPAETAFNCLLVKPFFVPPGELPQFSPIGEISILAELTAPSKKSRRPLNLHNPKHKSTNSLNSNVFVSVHSISDPEKDLEVTTSVYGSGGEGLKGINKNYSRSKLWFRIGIPLSDKEMELRAEKHLDKTQAKHTKRVKEMAKRNNWPPEKLEKALKKENRETRKQASKRGYRPNKTGIFEITCRYEDPSDTLLKTSLEAQPIRIEVIGPEQYIKHLGDSQFEKIIQRPWKH